ncbi:MAG: type 4a pilus biogenesis protein PilO [Nitrosomonadales bacterium]|nr:type 4a pilus biogenesis protein PilO [Nitrosomonadales bacterium]
MKQLFDEIRGQLGWQGMAGIALLLLAGIFLMLSLKPLEQEVAVMHTHLDAARSKTAMQSRTFSLGDRQKELDMFFESLPDERDVTDILASIYTVAEASGVEFKQAEYHINDKDRPRVEYGIVFPVQGEYAKIRLLVSRVLADHPAVALDQINFQRDRINNPILKAEIRLTLFIKPSM